MAQQKKSPGNAHVKRQSWSRGNGSYSYRGELKSGISMRKKQLSRKVRHEKAAFSGSEYKRVVKTGYMVDFT